MREGRDVMIQEGTFQIYQTDRGSYSWSLLDEEGEIIARAPTQYRTLGDCIAVIERVKRLAGRAALEDLPVPKSPGHERKLTRS